LVAITAGCDNYEPYVSLFIGVLAGITYYSVSGLLIKLRIDDPLDASPVHGGCGFLGVICVGLFDRKVGLFYTGSGHSLGI
jgi:Amt family ammonium transporter